MKKILDLIALEMENAFADCGYDKNYGRVTLSNRPDLCQYQCSGALAAAKAYKKAPIAIAGEVVQKLADSPSMSEVTAVMPGFINIKLRESFLAEYLKKMQESDRFGCEDTGNGETIVIDYGGPNVAKSLHVGHLRPAIIGESLKRIGRFVGYHMIGDVHLGDWGLQIGLIITELKERKPELPYFDPNYIGEYPKEPPFTISELEEIYPCASARSKEDAEFAKKAHDATYELQNGRRGYIALWQHILDVSITDLKKNYDNLDVSFDVWKKESDAQPYIPEMIEKMKAAGHAHLSQGALVVDVKEESDKKEIPPCMLLKSDGATLYSTTDLATLAEREALFHPEQVIYVVDKRQEMHFTQIFRCARKTGIVRDDTKLTFIGFGTMNGKDGKPFKTRDGGIMRLEDLIRDISDAVYEKMEDRDMPEEEARKISRIVGLSALKYGDLSNQASKDYVFDVDRFISFEGNTGPYILYTIVRIKSILAKYEELPEKYEGKAVILPARSESEKALQLELVKLNEVIELSFADLAPHRICQYIFDLANAFNKFYHETKIIAQSDQEVQAGYIRLITLTKDVLEQCIDLLGFEAPDRM